MRIWQKNLIATLALSVVMFGLFALKFSVATPDFILTAPLPPDMLFNLAGWAAGVPWVFNLIHELPFGLDRIAKFVLFGGVFVLYIALWFGLGLFYPRMAKTISNWGADLSYIIASVLFSGLVLLPLLRAGVFGLSDSNFLYPPLASAFWAALLAAVFVMPWHLLNPSHKNYDDNYDDSRRQTVKTLSTSLFLLSGLSVIGKTLLASVAWAQNALDSLLSRLPGLRPEITATEDHYTVSKNVVSPTIRENSWSLRITGMVNNELTLTLEDLKNLPTVERASTLMCISNQVGGDLIGNSIWTGVRLNDILELAGIQEGANELILRAADNYSDSFALNAGLRDGTIVAFLQNGEALTKAHGFPARVLVPGIYGMKNVKWVMEIEVTNEDYQGYWQTRGWSDLAIVRTLSIIDTPEATKLDDGRYAIAGMAFAGLRGIDSVEVSVDGGDSWQEAEVKPAINELCWNLWGFSWDPTPGEYDVLVRAKDGLGSLQTSAVARPLPDGASGYHSLKVLVKA